jgi:hypothetical protein
MVLFLSSAYAKEPTVLTYPDIGILSEEYGDHIDASMETGHLKNSTNIVNRSGDYCKRYVEKITMGELKKLLVFNASDLTLMLKEAEEQYGKRSVYFESCNYFSPYTHPWGNWLRDINTSLEWGKTDAYIDTEYSLLLVQFLNDEDLTGADQQVVNALYFNKERQFISNNRMRKGWVINLIEATTGIRFGNK